MDWYAVGGLIPFLNYDFERGKAYEVSVFYYTGAFSRLDFIGSVPLTSKIPTMTVH